MKDLGEPRIAVIGGGPIGHITAAALRDRQFSVTHFTGLPRPTRPRALFVWSSALRALERVGRMGMRSAVQDLIDRGQSIERMDILAWDGALLSALPIGSLGRSVGVPTVVLEPDRLVEVFAAPASAPVYPLDVEKIEPEDRWSRFTLRTNDDASHRFDLVLISDGRCSRFQRLIQDARSVPRPAFQDAFVGVHEGPLRLPAGTSQTVLGPRARIWFTPLRDPSAARTRRIAWYATVKRERGVHGPRVWNIDGLRAVFARGPKFVRDVLAAAPETEPFAIADVAPTRPWVRGGLALLGDAAHSPTPDLGFGACLGIEGAMTLVHYLARAKRQQPTTKVDEPTPADRWAAALVAYEARHFPRAQRLVELSRAAALLSMPDSGLGDAGRDLLTRNLFTGFATDDLRHLLAYEACPA